ncbi:MAG: SseB family protein [Ruminococcus sp.]|nr:SseB family protein [Ruminococcus sp.]
MADQINAQQAPQNIDNTELLEAIAAMRENFNQETQNKVINLTMRSAFFVPANISKTTELVEGKDKKLEFQDRSKAQFILINNQERGTFFPAFTDIEKMKAFFKDQNYRPFAMKFPDLATLTERTDTVNGFIIDPGSTNLPYSKEMLNGIKSAIIAQKEKLQKAQGEAPEGGSTEG